MTTLKTKRLFAMCFWIALIVIQSCYQKDPSKDQTKSNSKVELIVLGNVQDAGSPHIGCVKECCKDLFKNKSTKRRVSCLGVIDHQSKKTFLFDATPDIAQQLKDLKQASGLPSEFPSGVLLSHAHIGHYSGLMYLGKEGINSDRIPVYTMPKMKNFLEQNGPWSQLVALENIRLKAMEADSNISLSSLVNVTPLVVPHRDEFSETVGFIIEGPNASALFIPDIDKWEKWDRNIINVIKNVDYAFIDATFYDGKELNHRDISEIPHPFAIESMKLFKDLGEKEKAKINFIHLNHTNPLLNHGSDANQQVKLKGFNVAQSGVVFGL